MQLRRQQTKRRDQWQIDIIFDADKLRLRRIVHACNGFIIAGIDFHYWGIFKNDLGLVIAHAVDLVRNLFTLRFANNNAHQLVTAEADALAF